MEAAYIFARTFSSICYLILILDITSRAVGWIGAEKTRTGEFLTSVSRLFSYPFQYIFAPLVRRRPFFEWLPRLCGTVFIYLLAFSAEI